MRKYYVTTPIYYVNDRPHIGHTLTTVLADVFARYKKQSGYNIFSITGTDEHGLKIKQAAQKAGKTPQKFADEVSKDYKKAWKLLNINYGFFARTTDPRHKILAQKFIQRLYDSGYIYKGIYEGLYCIGCEKFLTGSDLSEEGCCPLHKPEQTIKQKEKNYFFKLSEFAPKVRALILDDKFEVIPKERKKEILSRIDQGVEDISFSREKLGWGVAVPWDSSQTVYVWVEALLFYWTFPQIAKKPFFWPPDTQFVGKEIIWFHAVIWPAMLLAAKEKLPRKLFAHSFFTLDGKKMSKSLGNIITPKQLTRRYGVDGTRYLLAKSVPYSDDSNVGMDKFDSWYTADLVNGWGNTIARVTALCEQNNVWLTEQPASVPSTKLRSEEIGGYHEHMNAYQFHVALDLIWRDIKQLDIDIDEDKPWTKSKQLTSGMLKSYLRRIKKINSLLFPFMPKTSEKVAEELVVQKKIKKLSLFPRLK
jgi:methionyl-tRNA synthetase